MTTWHVYVEGESDKRFLECLASHMNIDTEIEFRPIGGGLSKLHKVQPQMKQSSNEGNRLGVILDANSNCQQCRNELTTIIGELGVRVEKNFLFPDDTRAGCLETLLEELAVKLHQDLYSCFDEYEACLRLRGGYQLPGDKARVYAYCNALGIETCEKRRDYCSVKHWNLDNAPTLQPLKKFLRSLTR